MEEVLSRRVMDFLHAFLFRLADMGLVRELSLFRGLPHSLYSTRSPDTPKFFFQTLQVGEGGFLGHTHFEHGKISNFA